METTLVAEGLKFMVLGMGVVFVFLALLVQLMKWQAQIVQKFFPPPPPPKHVYTPSDDESARVAAIMAAVTAFRKQHSQG